MSRRIRLCRLLTLVPCLAFAQVQEKIDWPSFLGRHDLVWEELPRVWHEGAFVGNGLVGAMIYAESTNALQWDINRSDVADRGSRLQIGRFELRPSGEKLRGNMRLDLWNAEARGEIKTDLTSVEWRSFTHADKPVTFIEITDKRPKSGSKITFVPLPAVPAREDFKKTPIPEKERNPDARLGEHDGISFCIQPFTAGGGYCVAWCERELAPGHRLFAWTIDFVPAGLPGEVKATGDIRDALRQGLATAEKSHRDWWHAYWPRGAFVSIPDARLESFYWIQMYKLASGTRADRPALDLMGPWFRRTPWPKIWWNLNIQLTYWPVYGANRLEIGESLTRMLDANVTNLINNVPEAWRADAAAIARTSSYDCRGGVGGKDGEERGNLIWTMHNYWLHCRHSGDEAMLRDRFYPLLKRSVGYYLHLLKPGPDGKLHIPLSLSPEYPKTAPDTNYDLALLRWGLQTVIACDARFAAGDPFAARCRETLNQLAPPPVDEKQGFLIGAGQPLEISHRHFSHLFAIYPLHLLDFDAPADRALAEKSLDHWIGFEGALQGYSFTGASAMSSWLGRRGTNVKLLNEFLDRYVKMNTMYLEAGPVIETPLSGAASIHEVLLQSWAPEAFETRIRVFPALPDEWRDATIHRMLAEGAFEVSAVRRDGRTRFVVLKSLAGQPCVVDTGLDEPVPFAPARAFDVKTAPDRNGKRMTTIDLRKGESIILVSANHPLVPEERAIVPVSGQTGLANYYGSRKTPGVAQAADGSVILPAATAKLSGSELFLQGKGEDQNIGHWVRPEDHVAWKVAITKPGGFKVTARYAALGGGVKYLVEALDAEGNVIGSAIAERKPTGGWDKFQSSEVGSLKLPTAGTFEIRVRSADGKAPTMNLCGLALRL